jgi:hypothetical protein
VSEKRGIVWKDWRFNKTDADKFLETIAAGKPQVFNDDIKLDIITDVNLEPDKIYMYDSSKMVYNGPMRTAQFKEEYNALYQIKCPKCEKITNREECSMPLGGPLMCKLCYIDALMERRKPFEIQEYDIAMSL